MTRSITAPRIETDRLVLSPYLMDDADALIDNAGRPEVASMLESIPLPFTREAALDRIKRRTCNSERFTLAIRDRKTGRMIGEIAAATGPQGGIASLSYHLHRDFWGRGFISEAVDATLSHAFRTLGWFVIAADAFDDSQASIRVLEKFGFQPIGISDCQSPARDAVAAGTAFRLYRNRWSTPVLRSPRLTLRPPNHHDVPAQQALLNNAAVARMLTPVPHPYTMEMARAYLSGSISDPDDLDFALDAGAGFIGVASLAWLGPTERRIGFWLGEPHWQKGYMSEAVTEILRWAYTEGGVEQVYSAAFIDNHASQALHDKFGFERGALETEYSKARGQEMEAISYSLHRRAWEKRQ